MGMDPFESRVSSFEVEFPGRGGGAIREAVACDCCGGEVDDIIEVHGFILCRECVEDLMDDFEIQWTCGLGRREVMTCEKCFREIDEDMLLATYSGEDKEVIEVRAMCQACGTVHYRYIGSDEMDWE